MNDEVIIIRKRDGEKGKAETEMYIGDVSCEMALNMMCSALALLAVRAAPKPEHIDHNAERAAQLVKAYVNQYKVERAIESIWGNRANH